VVGISMSTRLIGPQNMGTWSMITAAATLLQSVFLTWQRGPLVRFGREEWLSKHTISATMAGRLPFLILGAFFSFVALFLIPNAWLGSIFKIPQFWCTAIFFLIIAAFIRDEVTSILKITYDIQFMALLNIAYAALVVVFYALLLTKKDHPSIFLWFVEGMVILPLLSYVWVWIKLIRQTKISLRMPDRSVFMQNFNYSWPLIPAFFVGYLSNWGDHILLQQFQSAQSVGLFAAAYKVIIPVTMLAAPLSTLVLPHLIGKSLTDPALIERYVLKIIPSIAACWALLMIPILCTLPFFFILIAGREFKAALLTVNVLAVLIPGTILSNLYCTLYSQQGRILQLTAVHTAMSIINIIVSLSLIPFMGILGCAIGTGVSYLCAQVFCILDQHHYLKLTTRSSLYIFLAMSVITVVQAVCTHNELLRQTVCIVGGLALIMIIRKWRIVDREVLDKLTTGRITSFIKPLRWLVIRS
jgi:O-antigen/teichoic acid export membrane protein